MVVGVNGDAAATAGDNTIDASVVFQRLETDFATSLEDAAAACKGEVESVVGSGFESYLSEHRGALAEVEAHGTSAGGNLRASAFDGANTDHDMAITYEGASRGPGPWRDGGYAYVPYSDGSTADGGAPPADGTGFSPYININ
ncbi:hypothetical protein LX16_3919 [Stackebrandtia albiflava]|uniref:Uncharacterized protein n=1 Tax=Stackebrandtia albiflava TaxID=406432 RepID=A0A562UY13_9ACTN|nr:hypothetical protein [Stackebrandtia albiflava]TWJ10502.1 hypothetical protein LX16_3919 [Stackebrandtia albiflava]